MDDAALSGVRSAATPIEVAPTRERGGFAQGLGAGIALSAVLLHVWLAIELAGMRAMYADFGGELPVLTALVISPAWRWGVPAVGALLVGLLVAKRPRTVTLYSVLAAVLCATVTMTWYASQTPIRELAGTIQGG